MFIFRFFYFICLIAAPKAVFSMHIMEGFLPASWSVFWYLAALPFVAIGLSQIRKKVSDHPHLKMLLAVAAAFTFILSALKIPSVTGSCSHPTGVAFGTLLFGPFIMTVIGTIVLLFQALLLAHGGITTLGANVVSMAVVGTLFAYLTFKGLHTIKAPKWLAISASAFIGDLSTYIMTSFQLAIAFPLPDGGFILSFEKFIGVFAITQVPLALTEAILTYLLMDIIEKYNPGELKKLAYFSVKKGNEHA